MAACDVSERRARTRFCLRFGLRLETCSDDVGDQFAEPSHEHELTIGRTVRPAKVSGQHAHELTRAIHQRRRLDGPEVGYGSDEPVGQERRVVVHVRDHDL